MFRDYHNVDIKRLAEICEKSPAMTEFIYAAVTPAGKEALEAARAKLRRPAWYVRVWHAITRKGDTHAAV